MSVLKETIIYDLFTGLYTKTHFNQILKSLDTANTNYSIIAIAVDNFNTLKNADDIILDISNCLLKYNYVSSRIENNKFSVIIPYPDKTENLISDILSFNNLDVKISFDITNK